MHYSRKHFALYLHVVQIAHDRLNCASNMHMNLHVECMMLEECQNCAFKVHLLSWNCMKNAQSLIKCTWIAGNQTTCKQHAIQKLNLHVECTISFKMHLKCTLFAHYIFVRVPFFFPKWGHSLLKDEYFWFYDRFCETRVAKSKENPY